jgi:hypothetical protein
MFISKYEKLTVRELRRILFDIENQDAEIVAIDFYDGDCQEIEGIVLENKITIQDRVSGEIKYINIEQQHN